MKVVVSTDDEHIALEAIAHGAEVIERPSHLADDKTPSIAVLQHALGLMSNDLELLVLLQPTNPLRPEGMFEAAWDLYTQKKCDSVLTVSPLLRKTGRVHHGVFQPGNYSFGQRSQDLQADYYENGLLYISSRSLILEGQITGSDNQALIVDHPFGQIDIDYPEDLQIAELFASVYSANKIR